MPSDKAPQKKSGSLISRLGDRMRKAHENHRNDDYKPPRMELPAGLNNAVARLSLIKFDQYKDGDLKGQDYFMAMGTCVYPEEYAGGFTQVGPIPLCDTPGRSKETFDDHYADMLQVLMGLGANPAGLEPEEIEPTVHALKEQAPYFKFRTWKGDKQEVVQRNGKWWIIKLKEQDGKWVEKGPAQGPFASEQLAKAKAPYAGREPNVQHSWGQACSWDGAGGDDDTTDESPIEEEPPPTPARGSSAKPNGVVSRTGAPTARKPEPEEVEEAIDEESEEAFNEFGDLVSLADKADDGDKDAQAQLKKMALDAGVSPKDIKGADDWASVAAMIEEAGGDVATEESEEAEEVEEEEEQSEDVIQPDVGDVVLYHPIDPTTKKPSKKAVQCEVARVDERLQRVDLKLLDNPKKGYKNVAWEAISTPED